MNNECFQLKISPQDIHELLYFMIIKLKFQELSMLNIKHLRYVQKYNITLITKLQIKSHIFSIVP